ncbi:thiamine phosphate synthase [Anaerotignum propionicum]|uniref:Thiamine-phosphate synthase n=1 Tax=Anaerotignum propionicum DSM 1682 TaxID=991789 RepID=A0A110A6X9_ANAPI|nr:thiamine phosphate synthase [Anaerotignum propionicum]AMJ39748.1 thiamine-phosphate synthase [Anaerotignum propionicum DSM 1682]SHE29124.1 thiamine-phosphate diphosphorylase [[Clostridium] propionicum DSM 1682] [Anaerotignum propionicum DSM 1682]
MKLDRESLLLYAVTDRAWLHGRKLAEDVEKALLGGATFVQLREKDASFEEFLEQAQEVKKVCKKYNVPFVINDNIEVALAVNADGIHVGQSDMEAGSVREKLGKDKIIGVSTRTVEEALLAQERGADYLGVGAMFQTSTKLDAADVTFEELKAICAAVEIPVVAIGGISNHNVAELGGTGIDGVAVVSAIFAAEDIRKATSEMKQNLESVVKA